MTKKLERPMCTCDFSGQFDQIDFNAMDPISVEFDQRPARLVSFAIDEVPFFADALNGFLNKQSGEENSFIGCHRVQVGNKQVAPTATYCASCIATGPIEQAPLKGPVVCVKRPMDQNVESQISQTQRNP